MVGTFVAAALVLTAAGQGRGGPERGERSDLAVGVCNEGIGDQPGAGAVNVIYADSGGLSSAGDQVWAQDSSGIEGVSEFADNLGCPLAAGDFDGDGFADLSVGSRVKMWPALSPPVP